MAKITINMVGDDYRLKLQRFDITTAGTKANAINNIHLYHSPDGD